MSHCRFPHKMPDLKHLERVLLVTPFGIGDALFTTPVIRALKENGVRQIDLLIGRRTRELFEDHPFVSRLFEWDKKRTKGWKQAALFWRLRRQNYQAVFDFSLSRQFPFWSWLFWGIPLRFGFNFRNRGGFLTHPVDLPEGYKGKPVVEYYKDLMKPLSIGQVSSELDFFLNQEDRRQADRQLNQFGISDSSFIIVAPGGGESWGRDARLKRWPVDFFAQLVRKIDQEYGLPFHSVLILGGKDEQFLGQALLEKLPDFKVHNLCGTLSIRTAGALIERTSLLIANDGGLVHMARALKTPTVALYGPVDPVVYGPYPPSVLAQAVTNTGPACRPCYQNMRYNAACIGVECLTTLTPDFVLETLKSRGFFEELCARPA